MIAISKLGMEAVDSDTKGVDAKVNDDLSMCSAWGTTLQVDILYGDLMAGRLETDRMSIRKQAQ